MWEVIRRSERYLRFYSQLIFFGLLITAHALYWEAIILVRQYENWTQADSERFQYLLDFFRNRGQYSPTTFHHKSLFLEGDDHACEANFRS
jgi:hypothetical protein